MTHIGWMASPINSTFNRLDQCASNPGNRAYCYAELAVCSLETIASTRCAYPWRDGQVKIVNYIAVLNAVLY